MTRARTLLTVWVAACAACDAGAWGNGDGSADSVVDRTGQSDVANDGPARLDLPRPEGWALGLWSGVMPPQSAAGASSLAGAVVQLRLDAIAAEVGAPELGYFYSGQLTWDVGGADQWTIALNDLGPSYAVWSYDPGLHSESLNVTATPDASHAVDLATAYIGSVDEVPPELVMDWSVRSGSVEETSGASIGARLRLLRQQ